MSLNRTFQSLKLATLFGGVIGLGFGCILTVNEIEPCASGSNNKLNKNGDCECRIGYDWCDQDDDDNLNCCYVGVGEGGTVGDGDGEGPGEGPGDGDGDAEGDGDGDDGPGDGDGDGDGDDPGTLPPENCSSEEEGAWWCTHDEAMGPQGSRLFVCENGSWVEDHVFLDEECKFNGWDFAYGCVDDGKQVVPICGDGSGAVCEAHEPASCVDDQVIAYCEYGKETYTNCFELCTVIGLDGETFEHGECDVSDPDDIACFCCDSGDPGCPI